MGVSGHMGLSDRLVTAAAGKPYRLLPYYGQGAPGGLTADRWRLGANGCMFYGMIPSPWGGIAPGTSREQTHENDLIFALAKKNVALGQLLAPAEPVGGDCFETLFFVNAKEHHAFITMNNVGLDLEQAATSTDQSSQTGNQLDNRKPWFSDLRPGSTMKQISVSLSRFHTLETSEYCVVLWDGVTDVSVLASGVAVELSKRRFEMTLLPGQVKILAFLPPTALPKLGLDAPTVVDNGARLGKDKRPSLWNLLLGLAGLLVALVATWAIGSARPTNAEC